MILARDVSGEVLAQRLSRLGYYPSRQAGNHILLTTMEHGEFHLSIPKHSALRVGTLAQVLRLAAKHHAITRDELLELLDLS